MIKIHEPIWDGFSVIYFLFQFVSACSIFYDTPMCSNLIRKNTICWKGLI